jgi:8-oxo-dGTP diphosphatase
MKVIVTAVIQRDDRRILIGQRRRNDTSPLKWEFPGGKVESGETPEAALARELEEELSARLEKCVELGRVRHKYATMPEELEIRFYAASIKEGTITPNEFEQIVWALPKELGNYDFLAANSQLIAQLATGRLKPAEILSELPHRSPKYR